MVAILGSLQTRRTRSWRSPAHTKLLAFFHLTFPAGMAADAAVNGFRREWNSDDDDSDLLQVQRRRQQRPAAGRDDESNPRRLLRRLGAAQRIAGMAPDTADARSGRSGRAGHGGVKYQSEPNLSRGGGVGPGSVVSVTTPTVRFNAIEQITPIRTERARAAPLEIYGRLVRGDGARSVASETLEQPAEHTFAVAAAVAGTEQWVVGGGKWAVDDGIDRGQAGQGKTSTRLLWARPGQLRLVMRAGLRDAGPTTMADGGHPAQLGGKSTKTRQGRGWEIRVNRMLTRQRSDIAPSERAVPQHRPTTPPPPTPSTTTAKLPDQVALARHQAIKRLEMGSRKGQSGDASTKLERGEEKGEDDGLSGSWSWRPRYGRQHAPKREGESEGEGEGEGGLRLWGLGRTMVGGRVVG
ncbi:MAG: hypothetical protein M1826_007706 [Phylliscum demangeonii]|nr:MAG: hypothetical protein M1826_007706 [Phylliscum demangeonii]